MLALIALVPSTASARDRAGSTLTLWRARGGAALRRRRDHAGHLRAVRGRGAARRRVTLNPYVLPLTMRDPDRALRDPAPRHGRVGRLFGPVMLGWFVDHRGARRDPDRAGAGVLSRSPRPRRAHTWRRHGCRARPSSAAVVLAVTGGEALYADMGHFGKRPIRLAWFFVVLPALVLNYFGQGALILATRPPSPIRSSSWRRLGADGRW